MTSEDLKTQAPALAPGPIGSPVAAFVAPDAMDYAQALVEDELEKLDEEQAESENTEFGSKLEGVSDADSEGDELRPKGAAP